MKFSFLHRPHPAVVAAVAIASIGALAWHINQRGAQNISQENIFHATVMEVVSTTEKDHPVRGKILEQNIVVEIVFPEGKENQTITNDFVEVSEGDQVLVQAPLLDQGDTTAYFLDVQRDRGLIFLVFVFVVMVGLVGGFKGLSALVGLIFSFAVIFLYIIPSILRGNDPLTTGLLGALGILVVSLYCSYGFNRKSLSALIGIFVSLMLVGVLAHTVVGTLHFSGTSTEESVYLQSETGGTLNIVGILIAGIIIAVIGILDDVAVTQASTVQSLASVDANLRGKRLFWAAMDVGRDHISAVINTLILAYTGAALPLLLLLAVNEFPISFTLNGEIIAEEIVRMIVSSIGLILAVPVTTVVSTLWVSHKT